MTTLSWLTGAALVALVCWPGQGLAARLRRHARSATPRAAEAIDVTGAIPLSDLPVHEDAEIISLVPACQGLTRRRLLDLGFTPGTHLRAVLQTFAGDPRAYHLRGTTIALRRDQAGAVLVRPLHDGLLSLEP